MLFEVDANFDRMKDSLPRKMHKIIRKVLNASQENGSAKVLNVCDLHKKYRKTKHISRLRQKHMPRILFFNDCVNNYNSNWSCKNIS